MRCGVVWAAHTQADVDTIGELWTGLLRTGGMADQIYAVDEDTILINIADGKYMDEVSRYWMHPRSNAPCQRSV
jgi:hypothetical protein